MSAVVTGFGSAGAAALLAPASPSDASSSSGGGTAFGTALLSALAGDTAAPTTPAAPVDPAPSADAAATTPTTPQTAPPAPTPAVFLGLATPAPAPLADAATTTAPSAPDEGPHGKSGSTRTADADPHHDAPSPAVADVFAAGQLAVQQALAAAPIPPAAPTPAPPVQTSASSAAVEAPIAATAAPTAAPTAAALAAAPAPAREASAQSIATAAPATAAQTSAPAPVIAPARPAAKTPSAPSTPNAGDALPTTPAAATPVPAPAPAPTFATALAAAAPAASTPSTPAPPLQQQLAQPVMTLARQPDGDHVVIVRVAPDDLGPVTVHARVSDTGVRIELFAPSDAGRDAIRQILTDLRRDLNATTANASVSVSDQNAPGTESGGGGRSAWTSPDQGSATGRGSTAPADTPDEQSPVRSADPADPAQPVAPSVALPGARTLDIVV
ncbi:flagellar hook-length control protein FliK [Leifsonia sp. NPDC056824]|uniref:flagellar hook-length control protein FliK n=1 Tax=Leifsonia sp. NPDC056824 TaxID=3345953 RepID=UPI0036ADA854